MGVEALGWEVAQAAQLVPYVQESIAPVRVLGYQGFRYKVDPGEGFVAGGRRG